MATSCGWARSRERTSRFGSENDRLPTVSSTTLRPKAKNGTDSDSTLPTTMNDVPPKIVKKLQTLYEIATELRSGRDFNITRLTLLKGLCADPEAAAQFALHLAKKALQAMPGSGRSASNKKQQYRRLASKAVRTTSAYLKKPTEDLEESLWTLLFEARELQSDYKRQRWGNVRLIESRELLVVETALECILHPQSSSDLGYRLARQYAERYESRYGNGLIPTSAPLVEDIVEFWGRHLLGRSWRKRLS